MPAWILLTRYGSYFVLLLLVGLSIWSVTIIVERHRFFKALSAVSTFDELKKKLSSLSQKELELWIAEHSLSVSVGAVQAGLAAKTHNPDAIDRAVRVYLSESRARMERGLSVLATLGANAPFIGLFGTVLGIIEAFGLLSSQQSDTQAVIGGVSEALVATGIGLFVAIPAVVAYNYFSKLVKTAIAEGEIARDLLVVRLRSEGV